jgi:hypothetical protein
MPEVKWHSVRTTQDGSLYLDEPSAAMGSDMIVRQVYIPAHFKILFEWNFHGCVYCPKAICNDISSC